jgi:hypothetical protein
MSLDLGKQQPSHTGNNSHSLRNIAVYSFIAVAMIAAFAGLLLVSPVHAQSAAVTNNSTSSATSSGAVTTSSAISTTTATNSTATSTTHNCPNMGASYNGTFPAA